MWNIAFSISSVLFALSIVLQWNGICYVIFGTTSYIFSFLAVVKEAYLTDKIIELEKKIKKLESEDYAE